MTKVSNANGMPNLGRAQKVADAVMAACAENRPTPTRPEIAAVTGVNHRTVHDYLGRLTSHGLLRIINGRTRRVIWHWVPTGAETIERPPEGLEAVREYVRCACQTHRPTPTSEQTASALGIPCAQTVLRRLSDLEELGELERESDGRHGTIWRWVKTNSTTRPCSGNRRYRSRSGLAVPRPPKPSVDQMEAGWRAMEGCRYRDDPIAVMDYGIGLRPRRPDPPRASTASLAVSVG